jgi:hypothetical protein
MSLTVKTTVSMPPSAATVAVQFIPLIFTALAGKRRPFLSRYSWAKELEIETRSNNVR